MKEKLGRIQMKELHERVTTAQEAASWIEDGMTLGLSGFTQAGDAKAVPLALVERAENEAFKVNIYTGASLGSNLDNRMAEAGIIRKRSPFQAERKMRDKINSGDMLFMDQHLSHMAEYVRSGVIGPIDFAVIEALSIKEDGTIIPTTSVGNSSVFAKHAKNIIVEINMAQPEWFEGIHDIYEPAEQGNRDPIPLLKADDRIGTTGIQANPENIRGIVFTDQRDSASAIVPPDVETERMAGHLLDFLGSEVELGRLGRSLAPLQAGIGSVANAVLYGLLDSDFEDLEIYSEVLQDAMFDLLDHGKAKFASSSSITLSEQKARHVFEHPERYRDKIVLRTQEISNHPEIIRRLGLISINTALELDVYGNVNSTHVSGTHMMNGIGGSGDFARNARLGIFVTKSTAKGGRISSIVPFVTHVDHTEHDVDVIVTEQGYADLRGLAPRERVERIIERCMHPQYREQMREYVHRAHAVSGHTPHMLESAFSWHRQLKETGTMLFPEEGHPTEGL